jgi:hypothetical protein
LANSENIRHIKLFVVISGLLGLQRVGLVTTKARA